MENKTKQEEPSGVQEVRHETQPSNEHPAEVDSELQPSILKLDVDCFEELFDWLSLQDLYSMGQTCKQLRQVAGYVFRSTYSGAQVEYKNSNIYIGNVEINGFVEFIENIAFGEDDANWFNFAKSNEFKSLKRIMLRNIIFTDEKVACIKHILNRAETVELTHCTVGAEFYERFLQYCHNMTKLAVEAFMWGEKCPKTESESESESEMDWEDHCRRPLVGTDNSWLLRKYPKLTCFELTGLDWGQETDELEIFFKTNPSVRKFLAGAFCFDMQWTNDTNLQLDDLSLLYENFESGLFYPFNEVSLPHIKRLTKRLHLCDKYEGYVLPKLAVPIDKYQTYSSSAFNSLSLENLRELCVLTICHEVNIEVLATRLMNLERLSISETTSEQILAFTGHSPKLNRIAVQKFNSNDVDLVKWNRERAQLARACKMTIFIDENVFLSVKWSTQKTSYSLVELKRFESCESDPDFRSYHQNFRR